MKKRMSDFEVGYCRPPKQHQWRKGQSGNPRGRPRKRPRRLYKLIEHVLSEKVELVEDGKPRKRLMFEIIVLQLWRAALTGNPRALRTYLKYESFARTKPARRVIKMSVRRAAEAYERTLNEGPPDGYANPITADMTVREAQAVYEAALRELDEEYGP